jgi:hypothetical protein
MLQTPASTLLVRGGRAVGVVPCRVYTLGGRAASLEFLMVVGGRYTVVTMIVQGKRVFLPVCGTVQGVVAGMPPAQTNTPDLPLACLPACLFHTWTGMGPVWRQALRTGLSTAAVPATASKL